MLSRSRVLVLAGAFALAALVAPLVAFAVDQEIAPGSSTPLAADKNGADGNFYRLIKLAFGTFHSGYTQVDAANPLPIGNNMWNGAAWDPQRGNYDTGALITFANNAAGTFNSGDQTNFNGRGVLCVGNLTVNAGTGNSITLNFQTKDLASGTYITLLSSAALAAPSAGAYTVYPGVTVSANVSASSPVGRVFRVQAVVAGTGLTNAGTVGCSVIN
jgi:hypothetical protein